MINNQTPYHRRLAARLQKSKERRGALQANRYTEIDRFMLQYEQAHLAYYGKKITLSYRHGWYYLAHEKMRHGALLAQTNLLLAKLQEEQYPTPKEENIE